MLEITNKSMPWKFQIVVKYLEMENFDASSPTNDAYVDKIERMAKRSKDSVKTLDTRFVSQDTLDRYSDNSVKRENTKARL
jgi:phage regulator Rha-like protein